MPRIKAASLEEHHEVVWAELTAALTRLLAQRDYDAINLGHIAAEAGIARNTLYNYAPDKTALVLAITERASRPVLNQVALLAGGPGSATNRLRAIINTLIQAFTDDTIRLMLRVGAFAPAQLNVVGEQRGSFGIVMASVETVLNDGVETGEFRPFADVALTVSLLGGIMRSATERMIHDALTPQQVIPAVEDLILAAITQR